MIRRPKRMEQSEAVFETKERSIPYLLKRSTGRRTLTICIDEKGDLSISVPMRTPDKEIRAFLDEKEKWIIEKIAESKKRQAKIDQKQFKDGHAFLFLGKKCPIKTLPGNVKRIKVEFINESWYITTPIGLKGAQAAGDIRKALIKWYRKQAVEIIGGRLFHFARVIGVEPKRIAVRTQKRLWGICDFKTQTIHINWQIILAPLDVIDYVVVHELCHLIVPDHSKRFWRHVAKILPDYKHQVKWLKDHAVDMVLPQA